MPLLTESDLPDLVAPALAGSLHVVMWGVYEAAALAEWQAMLPIAAYVDTERAGQVYRGKVIQSPAVLERMDPAATVVMFNYAYTRRFPEYAAVMDRLGLRYFAPTPMALACGIGGAAADDIALGRTASPLVRTGPPASRWERLAARLPAWRERRPDESGQRRGIALALVRLEVGGAERQMGALAAGLARHGLHSTLATLYPAPPEARAYAEGLAAAGIALALPEGTESPEHRHAAVIAAGADVAIPLWHLPPHMAWQTFQFYRLFQALRPEAVVCYLDQPNVLAGLGAVLADVPRVLLSGRNLNPTHFPHFFGGQCPDLRRAYQLLLACRGVRMSANSQVGARSYAEWLDLPPEAVTVIPNAVATWATDGPPRPRPAGLPRLLGLFRLSPEKRPLDFVETVARVLTTVPDLHATLCGDGSMREAMAARISELGLSERIDLTGVVDDVGARLAGAHLLLHTAEAEGTPNVILEAQALGVPVVASRSAGALDTLAPGLRPFTAEVGDCDGLAAAVRSLLGDPAKADALGLAAAAHVRRTYSTERLVEETLDALSVPAAAGPIDVGVNSECTGSFKRDKMPF